MHRLLPGGHLWKPWGWALLLPEHPLPARGVTDTLGMVPTVRLIHDDIGNGPPVVLVHGHPFDRSMWWPRLASLPPPLRGEGPPAPTTGRTSRPQPGSTPS